MTSLDQLADEELTLLEHGVVLGLLLQSLHEVKQFTEEELLEDEFLEIPEEGMDFTNEAGFAAGILGAVAALWRGEIPLGVWLFIMAMILRSGLTAAWNEGAASCGIQPGELSGRELSARDETIAIQVGFLGGFGEAIVLSGITAAVPGPLGPLLNRAGMWTARYIEAKGEAQAMACADQKLMWVWNPLKEHCTDCRRYNGRVYRASTWQRYNIRPRMSELECGGFRCGCSFQPTDEPATPGRPPNPAFF